MYIVQAFSGMIRFTANTFPFPSGVLVCIWYDTMANECKTSESMKNIQYLVGLGINEERILRLHGDTESEVHVLL